MLTCLALLDTIIKLGVAASISINILRIIIECLQCRRDRIFMITWQLASPQKCTGTANGGSAILWAGIMELAGLEPSKIITIDVDGPVWKDAKWGGMVRKEFNRMIVKI